METGQAFSVVVLSSALGGLIHSVVRPRATQLLIPASTKAVKLGSAGDVIIGVGAGLAIFFVAGALFGLEIDSAKGPNDLLRIVALGVISGFTGIRLLNTMSDQLLKKVESIDEKMQGLQDELRFRDQLMRGHFSMDSAPDRSLAIFDAILAVEPNHTGRWRVARCA